MKQRELPRCPTCGARPEYFLKTRLYGWLQGNMKCPYGHHMVKLDYPAGNKREAEKILIPKWLALVEEFESNRKSAPETD
ncbi:TPA: hypothetical protein UOR20_003918 [Escherichia coli]|nr:hypothetical protein [Escherichia coli]ELM8776594.1 hypothetical protein [Escherichia coli]EMA4402806.1 hypothetical protein [Escherichia coli]HAH8500952.1 hypothetical protein [Escherichia coli]HEL5853141.1 hypothetical protein [Escherichia coli]